MDRTREALLVRTTLTLEDKPKPDQRQNTDESHQDPLLIAQIVADVAVGAVKAILTAADRDLKKIHVRLVHVLLVQLRLVEGHRKVLVVEIVAEEARQHNSEVHLCAEGILALFDHEVAVLAPA